MNALELFLLGQDGGQFRVRIVYEPYFYVATALHFERLTGDVCATLESRFSNIDGMRAEAVEMVDLDVPNHVAGRKRVYAKLSFRTVKDLLNVRRELQPVIKSSQQREASMAAYGGQASEKVPNDLIETLVDIREYDVPYYMRAAIDLDIRVGAWHEISTAASSSGPSPHRQFGDALLGVRYQAVWRQDIMQKPESRIMAFDIECTKAELKFPNPDYDEVFMISYMIDGRGFLIISRTVVAENIDDFEYTPKPNFPGEFTIFNEIDEASLLQRFVQHCRELKPHIYVTYNGDFFDWPFLKRRCREHGIDLERTLGVASSSQQSSRGNEADGEFRGTAGPVHLDAFYWVKRDSYLPQGSQGLKAVTKCKLGYDPVEVDAEDMVRLAAEDPTIMAAYSVSDAVATYYLYVVYVNLFIFSLCTVIPNSAEDVLRKGSGTLCESLLLVQAHKANVVAPNKQQEPHIARHNGHVIETETYVGGHVECLETGVFRSDIEYDFAVEPAAFQELIDKVSRDVAFAVQVEGRANLADCTNYNDVCDSIKSQLAGLRDRPKRREQPFIYHLDVGAMYPNIILTNRLQPTAIASKEMCAACDYNVESNKCKRPMDWIWRGELNPATSSEVLQLRRQLMYEIVDGQPFHELDEGDQAQRLKTRLRDYSQRVYKKTRSVKEEHRTDLVCMRENSFYIDTVRAFRDRRNEYKALVKKWKKQRIKAEEAGNATESKAAEDMELLFDSLQLAHKCILNSFYGYVMRKGARWRSMPMAGIVTLTGANLITQARELVERIGRPLELDTDGIWCMLPSSFPENYDLVLNNGDGTTRKLTLSYPCAMLNADIHANYSNDQYQTLKRGNNGAVEYEISSQCSIFFEVDGPYRCMVLPASTAEGKLLKKRYAVFNHDGSLAELKGFELKRRGELELIKTFQSEVFKYFLLGDTLEGCYSSVAEVANQWLDVIESRGEGIDDHDILDLIAENRAMSREVSDYEGRKMTSLTTARRLADFLGDDMLADKGLQCKLIIASKPAGAPVTDRAVPTAIFATEPAIKRHFLRKWLKDTTIEGAVREVIDWDYYRERLEGVIRKIVTIPAALQKIANPVPRVSHPDWLRRLVSVRDDGRRQTKIDAHFKTCGKLSSSAKKNVDLCPNDNSDVGEKKRRTSLISIDLEDCVPGNCCANQGASWVGHASPARRPSLGLVTTPARKPSNDTPYKQLEPVAEEQATRSKASGRAPQIYDRFADWLADRKARWRSQRASRRGGTSAAPVRGGMPGGASRYNAAQRSECGDKQDSENRKRGAGVVDLLRRSGTSLSNGTWRVLEVRESEIPGELYAWVVTDVGHLHRVSVSVSRHMYVEVRQDAASVAAVATVGGRKAPHWRAPSSLKRTHTELYELRLSEQKYLAQERSFCTFLTHPGVEAVYELSTPLWFRALLSIGAGARVASTAKRKATKQNNFALDDLELAGPDDVGLGSFHVAFFYHSQCPSTGRGIVAVFFLNRNKKSRDNADGGDEASEHHATVTISFVDPFAPRGDRPPPIRRLYEAATRQNVDDESMNEDSNAYRNDEDVDRDDNEAGLQCQDDECNREKQDTLKKQSDWARTLKISKSEVVRDHPSALSSAAAALADYAAERHGTTLLVIQSAIPATLLRRSVPALADFPNIEARTHIADSTYPPLGWRNFVARRAFERLVECPPWLADRFATANFANLPVGNLGDDAFVRVADVAFARLLRRNRHLLWASEGSKPDLGSTDVEGHVEATGVHDSSAWESIMNPASATQVTSTNQKSGRFDMVDSPGVYRCACVEIDVFGSAVNAIMVSDKLDDDAMDVDFASGNTTEAIANGACEEPFRFLRALVADWIGDVANHSSAHADMLLVGFYRWLCARTSLLYFPALRHVCIELMRRVHARLVAELRRLGMRVVHASFHKLVLATPKSSIREGKEHLDFVARTLAARPVFRYLALAPKAFYSSLLFLDRHNYTAIEELSAVEDAGTISDGDRLVSNWALANKLPDLAREYFAILVGSFLHKPLQFARDLCKGDLASAQNDAVASAIASNVASFIDGYVSEKALAIVSEMQRAPDVHVGAAPLDFVTLLCHVVALDKTVEAHVIKLRRLLLATLGIREFSPRAHWKPSALAVVVPDVICTFCNACSDLDLTDITSNRATVNDNAAEVLCDKCACFNVRHWTVFPGQHPVDLLDLELRVLEIVEDLSAKVLLQDARCPKCARVATGSLAMLCSTAASFSHPLRDVCSIGPYCAGYCSGKYGLVDAPPSKFNDYLGACLAVAEKLNMNILTECCRRHLDTL